MRVPDDIWASGMLQEGVVERWCVPDGSLVASGQGVILVRVEDALHELVSPYAGRLRQSVKAGALIEPGMEVALIEA